MTQALPRSLVDFLAEYHAGGVSESDCQACSSPCCSHGGFAILENVLQIYERYRAGKLIRAGYQFESGASFEQFVFKYFDVYKKTVVLEEGETTVILFHMRSLSSDGHLIKIPAVGDYWETRAALFRSNPWMSRGCVFLSHGGPSWPEDDRDSSRHCILHVANSSSDVTSKPIDCVFYTCDRPIKAREPSVEQSIRWFQLLATHFPNSVERFEQLIGRPRSEEPSLEASGHNNAVQPSAGAPRRSWLSWWHMWRARRG